VTEAAVSVVAPAVIGAEDPHELARVTEDRLWTAYLVALARQQECWKLAREAWRAWVLTGLADPVLARQYDKYCELNIQLRDREDAARTAWEAVAYPLCGIRTG